MSDYRNLDLEAVAGHRNFSCSLGFPGIMARLVSIIGDANVRRNMTGLNVASREAMKNAQVIDYLGLCPIDQALQEVRPESTMCIIAAITEPIIASGDCGTIFASVDPTLASIHATVAAFCQAHQNLQVLLVFQPLTLVDFDLDLFCFNP